MRTRRRGDNGADVRHLQSLLNATGVVDISVDGDFGPKTEAAVETFQEHADIYMDGIAGPVTWRHLRKETEREELEASERLDTVKLRGAKKYNGEGYTHFRLREDVADALGRVQDDLVDLGGHLTSSGGLRSLRASVGTNRSATSLHYTGRAFDLFLYSGMVNPSKDPFVVTRDLDHERKFTVWARCPGGYPMQLDAVTYEKAEKSTGYPQVIVPVEGTFINFTERIRQEGFERISCRRSFLRCGRKNNGGAEWWHFQYEKGLVEGVTTFGDELFKIYTEAQVKGRPPWKYRHHVWGVNWH